MADDRRIVIELVATGGDGDEEEEGRDEEKDAKTRKKTILSAVKRVVGYTYQEIKAQALYNFDKYTSLTEDYKMATLVDNVQASISKVKSLASSSISTAILGAKVGALFGEGAGPAGAGIGALIGLTAAGTSMILDLSRQYQTQSLNLNLTDKEAKYAKSRLGLIDNGRGTQN